MKFIRRYLIALILKKPCYDDKFFLFPLHYEKDAQITFKEPLIHQVELIRDVSRSMPSGYFLYVKPHPHYLGTDFSFSDLLGISKLKNVKEWLKNNSKFSLWGWLYNSISPNKHQRQYR